MSTRDFDPQGLIVDSNSWNSQSYTSKFLKHQDFTHCSLEIKGNKMLYVIITNCNTTYSMSELV